MTIPNVNSSCSVTNNAGMPIVVLDAFQLASNVAANSPLMCYQQALKILTLQDGSQVIPAGQTGTVTLNDTSTNAQGQTQQNFLYQLLISEAQSLFPIMNVSEALNFNTLSYPSITVTADAATTMKLAFQFCKTIMAYPTSNLAKNFQQALTNGQQQTGIQAMMKAMTTFFQSTQQFSTLDFPSYLAVSTYIQSFAWVWGLNDDDTPNSAGRTYWLYAASDADQASASTGQPSSTQGSIMIQPAADGSNVADLTDPNSGYTINYIPQSGSAMSLSFSKGQFVSDPTSDAPAICLQGTYALKALFTHQTTDNVPWPILVGTVNGTQVIAVSQPPESWWQKNIASKTFSDWINMFSQGVGVWMALDFLKTKLASKANKLADDQTNQNQGEAPTEQQQQEAETASEEVGNSALQDQQNVANRMGQNASTIPNEQELSDRMSQVQEQTIQTQNEFTSDNYTAEIDQYATQIEEIAEIGVNPSLEEAENTLLDAENKLSSDNFTGVDADLTSIESSVGTAAQQLDPSGELQRQLAQNKEELKEAQEEVESSEESTEDASGDEEPFEGGEIEG